MFRGLRARWRAARERRFQERAVRYLKEHFSEVIGSDAALMSEPNAIDLLYEKHFGRSA